MKTAFMLMWVLLFISCSNDHAGGSSAETGNPEIAGVIKLPNGKPAALTQIQCVPVNFNPIKDTLNPIWKTQTDSLGAFTIKAPDSTCNLEAHNFSADLNLLIKSLTLQEKSPLLVHAQMQKTGKLRIGVPDSLNLDSGWVYIKGTSYVRFVTIKHQNIFLDSLPAATLDSIEFVSTKSSKSLVLAHSVMVESAQLILVKSAPLIINTSIELSHFANSDSLIGFPWVVRLDSTDLDFDFINPNAGALSFWNQDQELGYKIIQWNTLNKTALVWLRLDSILPNSSSIQVDLKFDESSPLRLSWSTPPFSKNDHIVAAWHFEESGDTAYDESANQFHGLKAYVKTEESVVGNGYWFDGVKSFVSVPNSESSLLNFDYNANATFSLWVRLDNPNTSRFIFGKGMYQYHFKYQYPSGWLFENNDQTNPANVFRYTLPFDTINDKGQWFHVGIVLNSGVAELFINGELTSSTLSTGATTYTRYVGNTFEIGRRINAALESGQFFWGNMDELFVWNVAHNADWIRMLYENQQK